MDNMKNVAVRAIPPLCLPRALALWMCIFVSGFAASPHLMAEDVNPDKSEWNLLTKFISQRINWNNDRLRKEVLRKEALILESDTTPVSIVLRRT